MNSRFGVLASFLLKKAAIILQEANRNEGMNQTVRQTKGGKRKRRWKKSGDIAEKTETDQCTPKESCVASDSKQRNMEPPWRRRRRSLTQIITLRQSMYIH